MRAVSVRQPWAWAIARGHQPVLNQAADTGYLIAAAGPLGVGFLHRATDGWTVPVLALLGVVGLQFWAGWLAGRARTLPSA